MSSSLIRYWTRVPCTGRKILSHWTTKEVLKLFLEKNFFLHFSGHLKVPGPSGITSFPLLYPAVIWPRDNSDLSGVSYQRMKCISGLDFKTLGNSPEKPKTELSQDLFSRLEDIDYPLWTKSQFRFGNLWKVLSFLTVHAFFTITWTSHEAFLDHCKECWHLGMKVNVILISYCCWFKLQKKISGLKQHKFIILLLRRL